MIDSEAINDQLRVGSGVIRHAVKERVEARLELRRGHRAFLLPQLRPLHRQHHLAYSTFQSTRLAYSCLQHCFTSTDYLRIAKLG